MTGDWEIVWLCDLDGTGSMHACSNGDPGAVEYVPYDLLAAAYRQGVEDAAREVRSVSRFAEGLKGDVAFTERLADMLYSVAKQIRPLEYKPEGE